MSAFPFTLQGAIQDWWYYLSAWVINWETIERLFLEKYFPASRLSTIRREIQDIRQRDKENLNAASGGSFLDRSLEDGIDLIERKAVDNQQYGTRENSVTLLKGVHEIENGVDGRRIDERLNKLESKLNKIASLFKTSTPQIAKCGICISTDHYTDECPSLMETTVENPSQVFAANTFGGNRPYQNYHDSSSSKYQQNWQPYVPPQQRHQPQPEMSLQDFMKIMLEQNSEIKKSIVDLTQRVEKLEAKESNKLPAHTVINPQNVSAITLRTGKQVQGPEGAQEDEDKEKEEAQLDDNGGLNEPSPETTTEKSRRHFRDNEVVNLGRNVSSLIKKHIEIPRKCKDPGMFSIPCVIGNSKFDNAMLD
ncbi:hypothetical protein V8G54_034400 [Vigna mungo]|uniref:Retrotransposon gag domain-containing protein n=1 Tax=Vigna mungo TaxID=3915 RepID=A0AAQ3MQ61_VIGMU